MIPIEAQRLEMVDEGSPDLVLELLKGVPCLAVIDVDLDQRIMEIVAKPELHKITIITKAPRQNFPEILKNKAEIFKVTQNNGNEVNHMIWMC